MIERPLVTAVIPARDAAAFVGDAITSVLSQTYSAVELIIVDDGSRDDTAVLAQSIGDARVTVISTHGIGVGAARNLGSTSGSGAFVAFLDADDLWLEDKLAAQVEVMQADPNCVAVGALMRYESLSGQVLGVAGQCVSDGDQAAIRSGHLMPFPISSVLFQRAALESVGGFDALLSSHLVPGQVEDLDLMARIARLGTVRCLSRVAGVYRIHGASASARQFRSQRLGTRYVRARLAARDRGSDLEWTEFVRNFRPSVKQRYGDLVQSRYRLAGQRAASGRWSSAVLAGAAALLLNPVYVLPRFTRQQRLRRGA